MDKQPDTNLTEVTPKDALRKTELELALERIKELEEKVREMEKEDEISTEFEVFIQTRYPKIFEEFWYVDVAVSKERPDWCQHGDCTPLHVFGHECMCGGKMPKAMKHSEGTNTHRFCLKPFDGEPNDFQCNRGDTWMLSLFFSMFNRIIINHTKSPDAPKDDKCPRCKGCGEDPEFKNCVKEWHVDTRCRLCNGTGKKFKDGDTDGYTYCYVCQKSTIDNPTKPIFPKDGDTDG